jgi:hypothetical protein
VLPDHLAPLVEQLGLRRLERPDKRGGVVWVGLTRLDLDATSMECEELDGVRRRLQILRDGCGAGGSPLRARYSSETPDERDGGE